MSKKPMRRLRAVRNARRWTSRARKVGLRTKISLHRRAIDRLLDEFRTGKVIDARFHGGVTSRGVASLLITGSRLVVQAEKPLKLNGRRYIPDLVVQCEKTGRLLLAIEVWDTHAVSNSKKRAYQSEGIPWIEVRAWSVMCWQREHPIPVLDWGGISLIESPCQQGLFEAAPACAKQPRESVTKLFEVRSRDWTLPAARTPVPFTPCGGGSFGTRLGAR